MWGYFKLTDLFKIKLRKNNCWLIWTEKKHKNNFNASLKS